VLAELAWDKDPSVRAGVAGNPSTPAEFLRKLADHENVRVRSAVASNPATHIEVLAKLAKDTESNVRYSVAGNPVIQSDQTGKFRSLKRRYRVHNAVVGFVVVAVFLSFGALFVSMPVWLDQLLYEILTWWRRQPLLIVPVLVAGILAAANRRARKRD